MSSCRCSRYVASARNSMSSSDETDPVDARRPSSISAARAHPCPVWGLCGSAHARTRAPPASRDDEEGSHASGALLVGHAARSSAVHCGHRVARNGIVDVQYGHSFVVGDAGAGALFSRLIWRTSMKTTKETITKLITVFTNMP